MKLINRTGERYGRLTVVKRAPNASERDTNARWQCRCDCGKVTVAYGQDLTKGRVKSCGCFNAERIAKHGMTRTPVYSVWVQMKARCENPQHPSFANYGGRGITVCEEWHDFRQFFADMGYRPRGLTIERIDNMAGYSKANCRWATMKQQQNNSRRNHRLELDGETRTISQWADHYGIQWDTIRSRLRYGWSIRKALTTPVGK
jgi:hypothetical protein